MNRDIKVLNSVQTLFKRPKIYTPNGTLDEMVSYLFGYRLAYILEWQVGNHKNDCVFWALEWLREELEIQTSIFLLNPADFTLALRKRFENNKDVAAFLDEKFNDAKNKNV